MAVKKSAPPKRSATSSLAPWQVVSEQQIFAAPPWIRLFRQTVLLPDGRIIDDYHRVQLADYAVIAARRELLEETGYVAEEWRSISRYVCNSNYGCGTAHLFAARNARQVAEPHSGDLEEMEILLLSAAETLQALRDGRMAALGAVTALALAFNLGR